jgi:ABC-type transport system involved in multi-copper enzyme maturation permease subunit
MVIENKIEPLGNWLASNAFGVIVALLALAGLSILVGFLAGSIRHGPFESFRYTWTTIVTGLKELGQLSPRRIGAVALLSMRESMRRRSIVVFVVFVFLLMFAGWFLDRSSDHPARLYLSFVMTSSGFLVILWAIFLSAFSIPNDIKSRTIYTIVTKPVRAWEFVLGRMIGFSAVGTLLLFFMGLVGYVFVERGLDHTHVVRADEMSRESLERDGAKIELRKGVSSISRTHRHEIEMEGDQQIRVTANRDHIHEAAVDGSRNVQLAQHHGMLQARVPILGTLEFLDRQGKFGDGVNPGYEWKYRKYIEGGTLATAIWRFQNIRASDFPHDRLRLEMTLRVFRTYKGEIEEPLTGTMELVRPAPRDEKGVRTASDGGLRSVAIDFKALDDDVFEREIHRKIKAVDSAGNERDVDLFRDLVSNGELEIWVRCLDRAQYFGMAPADLYLRAANRPFWMNFAKGYLSIWFQMVVVTCFGVMFSTFLNGAVAMLATLSSMVIGFNKSLIFGVASGDIPGGGPIESMVRIFSQKNQLVPIEGGPAIWIMKQIDGALMHVIQGVGFTMPNCGQFNNSNFIAYGYNVPSELVTQHFVITMLYCLVLTAVAYFFFKTREIAA